MFIDYFFDPEQVTVTTSENSRGHTQHVIDDLIIRMDGGLPHWSVHNDRFAELPPKLEKVVVRVAVYDGGFEYNFDRAPGLYKLDAAEAEVLRTKNEQGIASRVRVTAPTKEAALALWDAIQRGDIRPAEEHRQKQVRPTVSYDEITISSLDIKSLKRPIIRAFSNRHQTSEPTLTDVRESMSSGGPYLHHSFGAKRRLYLAEAIRKEIGNDLFDRDFAFLLR